MFIFIVVLLLGVLNLVGWFYVVVVVLIMLNVVFIVVIIIVGFVGWLIGDMFVWLVLIVGVV